MKTTILLLVLFLILGVGGSKPTGPDYIYKAAAQICKPYFDKCKKNPEKNISDCFQEVYYKCLPKYRSLLQSMEQCVIEDGVDLAAVLSCATDSHA